MLLILILLIEKEQERELEEKVYKQYLERRAAGAPRIPIDKDTFQKRDPVLPQLKSVPALSEEWIDHSLVFVPLLPIDSVVNAERGNDIPTITEEILQTLDEGLSALLSQRYHIFWSHILFHPPALRCVDTYLRYSKRNYDGGIPTSPSSLDFTVFVKVLKGTTSHSINHIQI